MRPEQSKGSSTQQDYHSCANTQSFFLRCEGGSHSFIHTFSWESGDGVTNLNIEFILKFLASLPRKIDQTISCQYRFP